MKIIFICGSLEKGCDGVGDYSRRLAGELINQGHEVSLIALYDKSATVVKEEDQESEGKYIPVLRIPNHVNQKIRFSVAKNYIDDYDPDWLSLQFVPFSFQKKGLPFMLGDQLVKIGKGRKWHIMIHELWVGMDKEASFKHKVWGNMQQYIVQKIIKVLKPIIVHTQSQFYQYQLEKIGCKVLHLPLFGNIALTKNNESFLDTAKNLVNFIVFGNIHANAPSQEFISELVEYTQVNELKIKLNFVGRCGSELDQWILVCKQHNIEFMVFGEQNSDTISNLLSHADWGITTTPWRHIEKSGTVAAMLEHGLKVICVARLWTPNDKIPENALNGVVEYKVGRLNFILNAKSNNDKGIDLKKIANTFVNNLDNK